MLSSSRFLKICQRVRDHGIIPEFLPGIRVGRGMADVGSEEFILIAENKLLSLFTGKVTEINQSERQHLFGVPSSDQMIAVIESAGSVIVRIEYIDRRFWSIELNSGQAVPLARTISEALLHALVVVSFSTEVAQKILSDLEVPRLITERVVNE